MTPPDSPSPRTDLCPECASDQPRWVALERQGQRCTDPWHGTYTAQEAPAPTWRDASPQEWDEANAALSAPPSPAEPPRPDYAALADAETAIIEAVRSGDGVGGIKAFQAYRDIIRAEAQQHSEPKEVSDD